METWFVFSGLGSQWDGMGRDLLVFEAFREAFEKSVDVLEPFGVDLKKYIADSTTFNTSNILFHTVCIISIEIALVDLLSSIDIAPKQIFGHSVGEFACAYADGCYNAKETLLTVVELIRACVDSNLPPGAMASVGLHWDDKEMPWKDTIPVCHNAIDNMTVAGSHASIKELVGNLKGAGIFAREIKSQGFAIHSDLMKPAEAQMMENILGLNLPTKTRSSKWISTSQSSDEIKVFSGRYFVNNIISPVLFHPVVQRIPSHAVVIEIAPQGLFQTILKRSLHETCVSISLTDRNQKSAPFFLRSVGKLFVSGLQPKINKLYPELKFPIRSATLPLSSIIQWNHNDTWKVAEDGFSGATNLVEINLTTLAQRFYSGYKINDQILFPASGFLVLVWRVLAEKVGTSLDYPITFENIVFNRVCFTSTQNITKLVCNIHASGYFEVRENDKSVVTGSVRFEEPEMFDIEAPFSEYSKRFTQVEVYERFKKAGYEFSGSFKSLLEVEVGNHSAITIWEGNCVKLLDSLIQLEIFSNLSNHALVPARIDKVTIDLECLRNQVDEGTPTEMPIYRDKNLKVVSCTGIEFRGVHLLPIKCFGDVQDNGKNCMTNFTTQSLSSFLVGFNKQLAARNIIKCHFAVDPDILELANNFILTDLGIDDPSKIGAEFSGVISGQKVMGLATFHATTAQLISVVHWRIPDNWSLRDAATVPTAYVTAYYALIVRGNVKHKENILIQYGDEAVGEAAIAIALGMKCTVFTTIRSEKNKPILLNRFPALDPAKILSSKHCHNLEKLIQKVTKGKGVNVVLNSSSGNPMRVSVRCVAEYGRYLQLMDGGIKNATDFRSDKKTILEATIGLSLFLRSVTFHGICKDIMMSTKEEEFNIVHSKLQEGIGLGIVKPLSIKHFEDAQLKEANWLQPRPSDLQKFVLEME
ncbi:unnamed protein product [Allacma fusca]|uniref:Fatty acid synthase n=1 Tax=Allacma fusca TaxID=39272 RepID=A0A8J2JQX4_9HEXA|nr:unnamed protein product [Allacma fusca]